MRECQLFPKQNQFCTLVNPDGRPSQGGVGWTSRPASRKSLSLFCGWEGWGGSISLSLRFLGRGGGTFSSREPQPSMT